MGECGDGSVSVWLGVGECVSGVWECVDGSGGVSGREWESVWLVVGECVAGSGRVCEW